MQIFLHQLDGSQTIAEINNNTEFNSFVSQNNFLNCSFALLLLLLYHYLIVNYTTSWSFMTKFLYDKIPL